jgi:DNA-binding NtrC family response regulator
VTDSKPRILLVDDEPNLRKVYAAILHQQGYEVHTEPDGAAALTRVRSAPGDTFDAVLTDLRMPNVDGMQLLETLIREEPGLPVIILTAHGSTDAAVKAMKLGAFDFLEKPFEKDQVQAVVAKAVATRARRGPSARTEISGGDPSIEVGMVGESEAIRAIRDIIRTVAASPSTVLITGESGTGKELVARALHLGSSRRDRPFIGVNCAAIPSGLVESELFGHEKGSFTGAEARRPGRFELADGGTLFLDEISEIPLDIQVKLLRAIQESSFERVGGVNTLRVDVRLVAATNRDLKTEIASKRFREDLYYRLNVVPIHLPALRERPEDIEPLAAHFVSRFNKRLGKAVEGFSADALEVMRRYAWPGNIRELENLAERMILFASGAQITVDDLPEETFLRGDRPDDERGAGRDDGEPRSIRLPLTSLGLDLKEAVKQGSRLVEEALIREALAQTDTNVTRSARLLGISRRSLQSKMKELGLREPPEDS